MAHPSQWQTTYSSVFRDRRSFRPPVVSPSDDSWSSRTQGYAGPRAALAEHAARSAEVEARTDYGLHPANELHVERMGGAGYGSPARSGGMGMSAGSPSFGSSGTGSPYGSTGAGMGMGAGAGMGASMSLTSPPRHAPVHKDLWNAPLLPLSPAASNAPSGPAAVMAATSSTIPLTFQNGWNNAYAAEPQPAPTQRYTPPTAGIQEPQQHVPGYAGFVRGQQFVHGETYGRMTRNLLAVPSSMPLEP